MITQEERNYLIESMSSLLDKYEYKHTENALNKIIDKWSTEKESFIEAFKKHPNYIPGKFMIAFTSDYERVVSPKASKDFSFWLANNALRRKDITRKEILNRKGDCAYLPEELWDFLVHLEWYAERCVSEYTTNVIKRAIPEVRVHVGEKTSRVVNKILTYMGYDKIEGYNKEFAKYADSLSPMVVKRHTVLSINPLDYLTMSFGNSWASCHTIDTKNKRDMPNSYHGAYSSGTMSYMLDKTSLVFYTVDSSYDGTEYWDQPKVTRQMFHYAEEKLIQGRLYPQDNDSCSGQYVAYRNIAQSVIANIFSLPNLWTFKTGAYECSKYTNSYGTHYRDYMNYDNCSISRIKGSNNENFLDIGASPICVRCGKEHGDPAHVDHCVMVRCEHCGDYIREDEAIVIDGHAYCRGCVSWCHVCKRYHRGNSTYIRDEGIDVCDDCRNEYYIMCEECGRYTRKENAHEKNGKKICKRCSERNKRIYNYNNLNWFVDEISSRYFTYYSDRSSSTEDDNAESFWRF